MGTYDIDCLIAEVGTTSSDPDWNPAFDLDSDGVITFDTSNGSSGGVNDDVDIMVREYLGTEYGDANFDRVIDSLDGDIILVNLGMVSGAVWSDGDFDGDGDVDSVDQSLYLANLGFDNSAAYGSSPSSAPITGVVPEPSTFFLAGALLLVAAAGRRARGR